MCGTFLGMGVANRPKADHPWRNRWTPAPKRKARSIEPGYETYEPRRTTRAADYQRIHEVVESINRF